VTPTGLPEDRLTAADAEASAQELQKRVYHLKTLFDVGQEIGVLKGMDEIAKTLLTMIMGTFGSLSGIVALVDTQRQCIETVARRGLDDEVSEALDCSIDPETVRALGECREIEIFGDGAEDTAEKRCRFLDVLASFKVRIWVPFRVDRHLVGGIGLGDKILGEPYSPDDQELLHTLARQGAVAMENAAYVEKMRKDEIVRTNLSRYLSPQFVEKVVNHDMELNLGGDRKTVTVLFSDIRDFTSITETRPPDQLVAVLNEYLTAMANCVFENQGIIDKYIGDAIMATFGSLVEIDNPAANSVRAAIEMMQILPALNENWRKKYDGFDLQIGIGITTGEAFIGNIGSPERMEYTAIGDTVNVASRFSGIAKAGQIIVGSRTLSELQGAFRFKDHPPAPVKGKSDKLEIFEIFY
jgi:adenylate cyclase